MPNPRRGPAQSASKAPDRPGIILIAGPFKREMAALADRILRAHRTVLWWSTCADTIRCASERQVEVVVSARDLDDGDWKLLLRGLAQLNSRPPLVVVSTDPSVQFRLGAVRLGAAACFSLPRLDQPARPALQI